MLAPERRNPADLRIALSLAALWVVVLVSAWACSDVRATESVPAAHPSEQPPAATAIPTHLTELWHAASTSSPQVLVAAGAVVTADGGTLTGRDPRTGRQLWHYRRDLPLCGAASQFGMVIGVYRTERGCSQTTMVAGSDGGRRTARTSYMDSTVNLTTDGTYFLAQGPQRLEMWRSDLVRTLEYGFVDAPVNVKTQPRQGCSLHSALSGPGRLAVLERCPDEPAQRLTVLDPAPNDNTVPTEFSSHVLTGPDANSPATRILAVSEDEIAVYFPGTTDGSSKPRITTFTSKGTETATHELSEKMSETARGDRIGPLITVFTGHSLLALRPTTLEPLWEMPGALGVPTAMAGKLLVPVTGGLAVVDGATGAELGRLPVTRPANLPGPLVLGAIGDTVLEWRNGNLVALGN